MYKQSCRTLFFLLARKKPNKNKIKFSLLLLAACEAQGKGELPLCLGPMEGIIVRHDGGARTTMTTTLPWQCAYGGVSLHGSFWDVAAAYVRRRRWRCHGSGVWRRLTGCRPENGLNLIERIRRCFIL